MQFHVERRAFVQMADDEIGVHYLDISRHCNVPCLDFAGTGSGKLQPLGTLTFHLQRDLLHVENDIGDVLTHARERGEFVQHIFDLDRSNDRTQSGRQKHAAKCRSEEHTSELPSTMRTTYAVFCLKNKKYKQV